MPQSSLPQDPLAAHAVVMQRAQQVYERRKEQRRQPLPGEAKAEVSLRRADQILHLEAEVIDISPHGMRLAAFVNQSVVIGDRCEIVAVSLLGQRSQWATVRWVDSHQLIQVFGVEFDAYGKQQ